MALLKALLKVVSYLTPFIVGVVVGIFVQQSFSQLWNPPIQTSGMVILDRVQALSQLTTTRYSFSNTVTSEREMPGILGVLYGDKLVMRAVGYVTAGIDMGKLTEEDIISQNGKVTIKLPPAELQDCFLDESASSVVSRDTGIFIRPLPQLDLDSRRFAIQSFRKMALDTGIMEDVQKQSRQVVRDFVRLVGTQSLEIEVLTTPPNPDVSPPPSCNP